MLKSSKTVIFCVLIAFCVFPLKSEATNSTDSKRTTFILSAEVGGDLLYQAFNTNLTFTVGHTYDNGLFLGGGAGVIGSWKEDVSFPFYAETRYVFPSNKRVSPYIDVKIGPAISSTGSKVNMYSSPSIGIDLGKTSFHLSYREIKRGYERLGGLQVGFSLKF